MIDFSKKRGKATRIAAAVICILLALLMIVGLVATAL